MAEFKLGRIRFVWKDLWVTGTVYYKDDVVRFGGKTYICQVGHTSNANFNVDLNFSPTKWNIMSEGQEWKGEWSTSTEYKIADIIKYGSYIYICNTGHTSAATTTLGLEADQSKWDLFAEGFDWKADWAINARYKKNDVVRYGGYTYVCNTGHTSAATIALGLEADQSKWDTFNPGFEYKIDWQTATRYKLNDVVRYGGGLWICITNHTSTDFISNEVNWDKLVDGIKFEEQWSNSETYQEGDVVRYGGNQYIAKTNHVGSVPSIATTDWALFSEGFNFANDWVETQSYRIGDVVRVNGNTYLAVADSPSTTITVSGTDQPTKEFTSNITTGLVSGMIVKFTGSVFGNVNLGATYYINDVIDAATFTINSDADGLEFTPLTASGTMTATVAAHPTNESYFKLLNSGISWQGTWADDSEYELNDAVQYGGNSYICIKKHRSEGDDGSTISLQGGGSDNSRPDLDINGTFWEVVSVGTETNVLIEPGDIVYYANGVGPVRLPIGTEGQVLRVSENDIPEWATLGYADFTYYVNSVSGVDSVNLPYGTTLDKPYRSIQFAASQVERGPRFPVAQRILEINRAFIQQEVTAWIRYQIANATVGSIWEDFEYNDFKCERDVGFIIDRVKWDLGHGGNLKIRAAAQTFLNVLGDGPFSTEDENNGTGLYNTLAQESVQGAAAYSFMLSLIEPVLLQTPPTQIYQNITDDSTAIAVQNFDPLVVSAENGAFETVSDLVNVIINVLTTRNVADIPARYVPNNLIKVATGRYREILPIIVPAGTCIIGEELRSTNAGPDASRTDLEDAFYTTRILNRFNTVVSSIVTGTAVTASPGVTEVQSANFPFASITESTIVSKLVETIKHRIDYELNTMYTAVLTDPIGYNSTYLIGYGDARKLVSYNKKFLQEEVIAFLISNYPTLPYSKTDTRRDVGYIIDAIIYDLTYGGNAMSVKAGLAYWDGDDDSLPQIPASIKTATLASLGHLKAKLSGVSLNSSITALQLEVLQFRGTAGSVEANTLINDNLDIIIELIDNGPVDAVYTLVDPTPANGVNTTTALIAAYNDLNTNATTIRNNTISWINSNFPDLVYDDEKCSRDIGIILKAVGYDFMFNSNYQTLKVAHAYLRETAAEVYTLNQKTITRAAIDYALNTLAVADVNSDATAIASIEISAGIIDNVIYGATNEGSSCQTEERNRDYAALQLELNRNFIIDEMSSFIENEFSTLIQSTDSVDNSFRLDDGLPADGLAWLTRNAGIKFDGTVFGGIVAGKKYYVREILTDARFTISETRFGPEFELTSSTGSMTLALFYDRQLGESVLGEKDVGTYIDAIKYDLKYPGNYRSKYVARYYVNEVAGSLEEDMFYLHDGTGVRDMTLDGLRGDLTPPNSLGTSRVTAGAYCSLDPGWGPDDFTTWIINRSPYVQNVTTFGTAAIGQKIDGSLHNGGNDSIVSNDFTQVISDGIGAWVTNNGRAELVSVFSYYAHIGYLSENGGRIRGTNGNNSYGDFGSVAEGVDSTEIPGTAVVDNIFRFVAEVSSIRTDSNQLLRFEFLNAGIDYSEVTWGVTGGGIAASVVADEFRDGGVFQVRLLSGESDELEFGGLGYLTAASTAQGGSSTTIVLAATDSNASSRYTGMTIILNGGSAAGQTAIISSYDSGTKEATVVKISDGTSGWDHLVPGTAIVSPDASTTYTINPTVSFTSPPFTDQIITLPTPAYYPSVVFGQTTATYTEVTGTYSGTTETIQAEFTVIRNAWKYFVTVTNPGAGYERLETITIPGTSLGGATPANDLTITITSVDTLTGAIVVLDDEFNPVKSFDEEGTGIGGIFVTTGAYSYDGINWTNIPSLLLSSFGKMASGLIDDGSSIGKVSKFVACNNNVNLFAISEDGINWSNVSAPVPFSYTSVAFGSGRFVAVSQNTTTVVISLDGEVFDITGTLPATGYTDVTYGKGLFVAIKPNTTNVAVSTDGVAWTLRTLPASLAWNSITFGNNKFVVVAADSNNGAYSLNGITWTTMTMGSLDGSTVAAYQQVRYGQGLFMATAYTGSSQDYSWVATSEDGINWEAKGVSGLATRGYNALAFGTPNRVGTWVVLPGGSEFTANNIGAAIRTGATTKAVVSVADSKIFEVLIVEPGSGYTTPPVMTVTDPGEIYSVYHEVRIGKGVLANPTFVSRGTNFISGSAVVSSGDGFADNYQPIGVIAVRRFSKRPVAGSNIVFGHLPNRVFKLVNILTFNGTVDGSYSAFIQISPPFTIEDAPDHLTSLDTRIRYSQVRLTGHDFLDIGTGNFIETNYPGAPQDAPIPGNETKELAGGRVFFTSTDQDGNFRVGDLFAVEQSTGIATLNADAFNISGLNELNLGNVTLGGGSATITEFSTDPFFSADSDNVVPTQRAIKAYIASQIGGGGAALNVNSITAGSILINSNQITTITGGAIQINSTFDFRGGIIGIPLALNFMLI